MSAVRRNETGEAAAASTQAASAGDGRGCGSGARRELAAHEIECLGSDHKLAILATLDEGELPHLTLITSLEAKDPTRLMFGQFCEGRAKTNLQRDARAGFLVLDRSGTVISGTARWCGSATSGADYEAYNRKPMFRYNAYSGIHRVHYLDVVRVAAPQRLSFARSAVAALGVGAIRLVSRHRGGRPALTPWAVRHVNAIKTLKFAGAVGPDGFPSIAAAVPCAALGRGHIALGSSRLGTFPPGWVPQGTVAVLALNLDFESVLVRGRAGAASSVIAPRIAVVEIEDVYNSMPFKQGPIYPMPPLEAVTDFEPARL